MKPTNINEIHNSFTIQASHFEDSTMNFSKQEYLEHTIQCINAKKTDSVLEVAAGTCICGRSIAPFVNSVTCVDATPAMLEIGKEQAIAAGLSNLSFVNGFVEELPFAEESFDVVMTRLSFHHFTEMKQPFDEMNRVLKRGGKLVIIDMEATAEELRTIEDELETLRDPSHVRNRSKEEFLTLYESKGYQLTKLEYTQIPVSLQAWMNLTKTPSDVQTNIRERMVTELKGGAKTGFAPYYKGEELYFDQRWLLMIGEKSL